jgi:hypothetical protein
MAVELQRFVCNRCRLTRVQLAVLVAGGTALAAAQSGAVSQGAPAEAPSRLTIPAGAEAIEQRSQGSKAPPELTASFDGLGIGFDGPQGTAALRNPSDNTLAVGHDHIVQIVNSRTAIFTKKGRRFAETGRVLYGPVPTNNAFKGFGRSCEARNNGDAVVRYDQLADRWLIVMPVFSRAAERADQPPMWQSGTTVSVRQQGTYAPDSAFRWMASPAIDRFGNIGVGFSHGGPSDYAGQRFAVRLAGDPLGTLTLREQSLVAGEDVQNAMRWQDYTQTAIDPDDDCTMWYVGDYIKKGAASYSTRIGAFRLPGCGAVRRER